MGFVEIESNMKNIKQSKLLLSQLTDIKTTRKYLMIFSSLLIILMYFSDSINKLDFGFFSLEMQDNNPINNTSTSNLNTTFNEMHEYIKNAKNTPEILEDLLNAKLLTIEKQINGKKASIKFNFTISILFIITTYLTLLFYLLIKIQTINNNEDETKNK